MLSAIQRHFSVVSLLLIAGAGLIVLEGPVGPSFLHHMRGQKPVEKQPVKDTAIQLHADAAKSTKTINLISPNSTWADTMDDAAIHPKVFGEFSLNEKPDAPQLTK